VREKFWRGRSLYDNFHHYLVSADVYSSVSVEIIADASDAVSYAVTYILGAVLYRISAEYDKESDMNLV